MDEREKLEKIISEIEDLRSSLGDAATDAAKASLRESLSNRESSMARDAPASPAERRILTVLFCDVAGSTAMAESMDPEEWTGIMNQAFKLLNESIVRYGGTVARLMGDAILAFFGAPLAHENDPERAVLAGLAILENIAPLRKRLKNENNLDFNVRVGINTGLVVVGDVGSEIRGEYTAMGDTVNLAARMEQTAAPGTIQIAEDTYQQVSKLFEMERLGGIQVKGKSAAVQTYRVLRGKPEVTRRHGLEDIGLSSPIIGRESELAKLKAAVQRLQVDGEGGLVLVFGEAGIGKSRLKDELKMEAGEALNWLEASAVVFGKNLSYLPFQEILRGFAGITEEDDESTAWSKLEVSITRVHGENAIDIIPYLASILALEVREPYLEKVVYLEAEDMGRQVYLALPRFLEKLAQDLPLMLVFEDLHWMDDASERLLEHLLALINRAPILIIGLSRYDPETTGERLGKLAHEKYEDRYTEISLSALPEEASQSLVENLLANSDLPPSMRQGILSRAAGNPFFLEEIVRSLIESGAVAQEHGTSSWFATEPGENLQLPDTIQGVIMARVDRLAEEVKDVLRTASVVGRNFLYRVLKVVAEREQNLDQNLAALETVDLIRKKQRLPELEFIFKHALAQETVYGSILLQTRRGLHMQVAQAIENLFADRLEEFFGLLAYHYARAEAREEALEYLLKAGDRAGQLAADGEALTYYHQAISTYEQAFGKSWDPHQRAVLERKIGQALFRRGEHEQALEHLKQVLHLLDQPLPESTLGVQLAVLSEMIQQLFLRLVPGLLRKDGGAEAHPGDVECILTYESILWIDLVGHPNRFLLDTLKVVNLSERIDYTERLVYGYSVLGGALSFVGLYGLAERYTRYALALAEKMDNPASLGDVYHLQTAIASWQGQVERAIEHGGLAIQLLRETGFIRDWGNACLFLVEALVFASQYARVIPIADEMIKVGQESGDLEVLAWGYSVLGLVERYTGDPEVSIAEYQKFVEISTQIPDYVSQVEGLVMIAHNYLLMGMVEPALTSLENAERIFRERKVSGYRFTSRVRIGFAWAYLLAAENASGGEEKSQLPRAARACKSALKSVRSFRPFASEAYRLQGTCDWLHGRKRQARNWWDKGLTISSEIGQPYEQAMIYMEMGERLGENSYVERAKEILEEIGARNPGEPG